MSETIGISGASAAASTSLLKLRPDWYNMVGLAFGLREPAILGGAHIAAGAIIDLAALDQAMANFVDEPVPDDLCGDTPAIGLVSRVLHWTGALQRRLQIPVFGRGYMKPFPAAEDGSQTINLAVPYYAPQATSAALAWVAGIVGDCLIAGRLSPQGRETAHKQLVQAAPTIQKYRPQGLNTFRLLRVAHDRKVPARQFMPGMFCLGVGARSRWLQSSFTDRTPILATRVAGNKVTAAHMLRAAGLPVAPHTLAKSPEDAVSIAKRMGYPVVVKPADRAQGRGVSAQLRSDGTVAAAYVKAQKFSQNILVEKHFEGTDHRMIVLDGRLVKVSSHTPFGVVGDGHHTVAELVELAKQTPAHRQEASARGGSLIDIDDEARALLAEQQLTPDSVLSPDRHVRLRQLANVAAGATRNDVDLDDVHPDNRRLAERAAAALRLDVAGADVILPDISRSWLETGAHICEVNAQPQFGERAAEEMLPRILEGDGRIPILLVIAREEAVDWRALRRQSPGCGTIGFASDDGAWLGDDRLTGRLGSAFRASQILLNDTKTEAAVVVMSPGEVRQLGLPFYACDVLIIEDHNGWSDEDAASLSRILDIALPHTARAVAMTPPDALGLLPEAADKLQAPEHESIQHVCETLLVDLLSSDAAPDDQV